MKYVAQAAKAVCAAVVAGLSSLGAVLVDGKTLGDVSSAQWVVIASAVVAAAYAVYMTPNKPSA